MLGLIGFGDDRTHAFTLGFLYILPVLIVTVGAGQIAGWATAVASSVISLLVHLQHQSFKVVLGPYSAAAVRFAILSFAVLVISSLQRSLVRERELARIDPLSGVSNRRGMHERAEIEVARARRTSEPLSMVYLDIDDFKAINDRFGHAAGDELLRQLARTLVEATRESDVVARMGGDEFVLVLPNTKEEGAELVLEKVRDRFRRVAGARGWAVDLSAGTVTYDQAPRSADEMVERADAVLYAAKRGRQRQDA